LIIAGRAFYSMMDTPFTDLKIKIVRAGYVGNTLRRLWGIL
jgi:hypothetical protein